MGYSISTKQYMSVYIQIRKYYIVLLKIYQIM
jgi:hypothetical protein